MNNLMSHEYLGSDYQHVHQVHDSCMEFHNEFHGWDMCYFIVGIGCLWEARGISAPTYHQQMLESIVS